MFHLVLLLAAAALMSLQSATGALLSNKIDADNTLQSNVVPTTHKRFLRKYVKIITPPPESVRLFPGQRLQLECHATGSPIPRISWLKNGEPVVDYEEEANEIMSVHSTSFGHMVARLVLNGAADGDIYTCLASAGLNRQKASTNVFIDEVENSDILLEKLLTTPKPIITAFYDEIFQSMGTNIVLPCRVAGKAQLYWKDNYDNLLYNNARLRVLPSGDLLIQSLRWSDMGEYTCVAQNEFGEDTAVTFLYPVKA